MTEPAAAANIASTTGSTLNKLTYKILPLFDPIYYRKWATEVKDAFIEREWNHYLFPTMKDETGKDIPHDPRVETAAKAFINQSIPYQHKASI